MPLPASGSISMSQMNTEFARGTSLSQYYSTASHPPHLWRMNIVIPSHGDNRANVPSSGPISFSDYYKKRKLIAKNFSSTPSGNTSWIGTYTFLKDTIYSHRHSPYWSLYGFHYNQGAYAQLPLFNSIISTGGNINNGAKFNIPGTSFESNCQAHSYFLTMNFDVNGTTNALTAFTKFEYLQNGTITYDPGTNSYFDKLNKSASSGLGSSTYAGPEISSMYITDMYSQIYDFGYWNFTNQVYNYKSYSGNCPQGTGSNQHNDLTPDSINIDAWFSYLSTRQVLSNGSYLEVPFVTTGNRRSRQAMSQSGQQTTNFRGYQFLFSGNWYNPAQSAVFGMPHSISFNGSNYVWNPAYVISTSQNGSATGGAVYHFSYNQNH